MLWKEKSFKGAQNIVTSLFLRLSCTSISSFSLTRPVITNEAPSLLNRIAVERPIPEVAPKKICHNLTAMKQSLK